MIYLLHSTVALGGTGQHSARHYLGWCHDENLKQRIADHRAGKAHCAITSAYVRAGAQLLLVACLPGGTRADERSIKRVSHLAQRCPICNGEKVKVGWPNGLVALIRRNRRLTNVSAKPPTANGGASPAPSSTDPTSPAGLSPRVPGPASTTWSGGRWHALEPGGTYLTVVVPPSPPASTPPAGTKPPCS